MFSHTELAQMVYMHARSDKIDARILNNFLGFRRNVMHQFVYISINK